MEQTISDIIERTKALDALAEMGQEFTKAMKAIEADQEAYWNSLTKDQQLDLFCCVVRRIHKAEIQDKGTYRYALYSIFGFDESSYTLALDAGYMDIHNSIFTSDDADNGKSV